MKTDCRPLLPLLAVTLAVVAWAYWTTLADIADRWATDPQYSHGFLVPLFSVYLLWSRRRAAGGAPTCGPRWWGVGLVALGGRAAARGPRASTSRGSTPARCWSSWPGSSRRRAAGGRSAWAAPAILFLAFMLPLPYRVQTLLGGTPPAGRDGREHLRPADARGPGGGRGERDPADRDPARGGRGVQRAEHAGHVLRPGDGGGDPGPTGRWLEKAVIVLSAVPIAVAGERRPDHRDRAAVRGQPGRPGPGGVPRPGRVADDAAGPGDAARASCTSWAGRWSRSAAPAGRRNRRPAAA